MAVARIAALILLFAACAPFHIVSKLLFGRSAWPPRFLAASAWICGARVRVTGRPIEPHTLLICNHTSWLDILVMGGATGCAFVSKDSLGHPLVHWMADQGGTLYVRRDHRRGAQSQADAIARKLQSAQPLALFPEGTTGPGTHMLPFRSALLSAVAPPPTEVEVRPVAIDYGKAAPEFGWFHEPGRDNVLRTLGRTQPVHIVVRLLDPLATMKDRKALTHSARESIAEALAFGDGGANL